MTTLASVLHGRNDGWKDDKRALICLCSMIGEMDEVWYIDWNSQQKSLIENIRNDLPKTGKLHHVVINPSLVKELMELYPEAEVCNSTLALNIGIRRAKTDWIISTTMDNIAPPRDILLEKLKRVDTFYTISRRDASITICNNFSFSEWRALRDELEKTSVARYYLDEVSPNDHASIINCCGDFQCGSRMIWDNIRGIEEGMVYSLFLDTNVQRKAITHGFKLRPLFEPSVFHMEHANYLAQSTHREGAKKYNNPLIWVENFEKTYNHRQWGCNDIELPIEII